LDKEIIVGETPMFLGVNEVLDVEPIALRIVGKVFDGLRA
jgi:hypothetical protein